MPLLLLGLIGLLGLELTVDPPSNQPFARQELRVTMAQTDAAALDVILELVVDPPKQTSRTTRRRITSETARAEARLPYELFEPGTHTLALDAKVGDEVVAHWEATVDVAVDDQPWSFPNYYRQQLTVVRDGEATRQPAPAEGVVPRPAIEAPAVSIGVDNRLRRHGEIWYPIAIYTTPNNDRQVAELAEAGFDLVIVPSAEPEILRRYLDLLHRHELMAWVPIGHLLDFSEGDVADKQAKLAELVRVVGDHPALAIWESWDEPAWNGRPAWGFIEGYRYLRALDPHHPIWTNHAPRNRIQTLAWYNQATDIAGCDVYPVPTPQTQSDLPNKTIGVVADETAKSIASVLDEKPIFMVLQGFAWKALRDAAAPDAVYPTYEQSRFMAYDAAIAGAAGLFYWGVRYVPKPSPFWSDLKRLGTELRALEPALAALPVTGDGAAKLVAGETLRLTHRRAGDRQVLLLVNHADDAAEAVLELPAAGAWHGLFDDPDPRVDGRRLTVTVPGWSAVALTDDPGWRPKRKEFTAELAHARTPQPLPREAGNPVPNPSFESESTGDGVPDGWEQRFPLTVFHDPTIARTGQASVRLEGEKDGFRPLAVIRNVVLEPDQEYRLSGWIRSDTPTIRARVYIEWVVDGKWYPKLTDWTTPGADWQQVMVEFTTTPAPVAAPYVVVQVDGPGRVWFDDIRVEPR